MTLRDYYDDEIKELDARTRFYDQNDDYSVSGEIGRVFGSALGVSGLPNIVKKPLTYGFNHYITAPGAALFRKLTSDKFEGNEKFQDLEKTVGGFYENRDFEKTLVGLPEDVKLARRQHRRKHLQRQQVLKEGKPWYSILQPRKPSAVTSRDGFILSEVVQQSMSDPITSILNAAQAQRLPPDELELKGFSPKAIQKADRIWNNRGGEGYMRNASGRWVKTLAGFVGEGRPGVRPGGAPSRPRGTRPRGTRSKTFRGQSRYPGGRYYNRRSATTSGQRKFATKQMRGMQSVSGQFINSVSTGGASYTLQGNSRRGIEDLERVFCGTIQFNSSGLTTWVSNGSSSPDTGGNMFFSPRNAYYLNGNSEITARADRNLKYRIRGGLVTFIPCISGYSQPDWRLNVMIATTPDFLWGLQTNSAAFVGSPTTPTTVSTLTQNTIVSSKMACVQAAWKNQITCPIPRSKWLSTASPVTNSSGIIPFSATIANLRETIAFILSVSLSGATPGVTTNAMNVWMDLDIQFKDQCPASTSAITLLDPLEPLEVKQLRRVLAAIKADDDVDKLAQDTDSDIKSQSGDDKPKISLRSNARLEDILMRRPLSPAPSRSSAPKSSSTKN